MKPRNKSDFVCQALVIRSLMESSEIKLLSLIAMIQRYSLVLSRLTALVLCVILNKWLLPFKAQFWIFIKVVYWQCYLVVTWLVPHETAAVSTHVLCTPYNHAPVYSVTSFRATYVGCMCVYLQTAIREIFTYLYYFKCTFFSPCVKGFFLIFMLCILMNNKDLFDLIWFGLLGRTVSQTTINVTYFHHHINEKGQSRCTEEMQRKWCSWLCCSLQRYVTMLVG